MWDKCNSLGLLTEGLKEVVLPSDLPCQVLFALDEHLSPLGTHGTPTIPSQTQGPTTDPPAANFLLKAQLL